MRALAHPLRVRLLELIRRDGEITATRAAELLDDSPGNMSWHLQTLAKYGFVEEAEGGRGRSRPWRMTRRSERFDTSVADPEAAEDIEDGEEGEDEGEACAADPACADEAAASCERFLPGSGSIDTVAVRPAISRKSGGISSSFTRTGMR